MIIARILKLGHFKSESEKKKTHNGYTVINRIFNNNIHVLFLFFFKKAQYKTTSL